MKFAVVILAFAGGCATQAPAVVARPAAPVAKPSGGSETRLGWVRWDGSQLSACTHRIGDDGGQVGPLGPCKEIDSQGVAHAIAPPAGAPDGSFADAGPWSGCHLRLDEMQLVPKTVPGRAWLIDRTGARTLIAEWTPEASVSGDRFRLEATFSPDGKWMALVEVAIGVGEGESLIEIAGARVFPVPACADAPRG